MKRISILNMGLISPIQSPGVGVDDWVTAIISLKEKLPAE
ncbi:hypothetical protein MNBD_CHLOROFLEXI01-4012 [hydrothermal vent metagenome]|uniref:Uncharacterized protein n=1 Tax=hydrothermal vent metagenome TaxID=652676 RepID=A0A3B0VAM0_9ZZZZ